PQPTTPPPPVPPAMTPALPGEGVLPPPAPTPAPTAPAPVPPAQGEPPKTPCFPGVRVRFGLDCQSLLVRSYRLPKMGRAEGSWRDSGAAKPPKRCDKYNFLFNK